MQHAHRYRCSTGLWKRYMQRIGFGHCIAFFDFSKILFKLGRGRMHASKCMQLHAKTIACKTLACKTQYGFCVVKVCCVAEFIYLSCYFLIQSFLFCSISSKLFVKIFYCTFRSFTLTHLFFSQCVNSSGSWRKSQKLSLKI